MDYAKVYSVARERMLGRTWSLNVETWVDRDGAGKLEWKIFFEVGREWKSLAAPSGEELVERLEKFLAEPKVDGVGEVAIPEPAEPVPSVVRSAAAMRIPF
jgi:hypothetical protein